MSLISKDQIILDCAEGYRTASGTTDLVPVGQLGTLIAALTASGGDTGLPKVYLGEYTMTVDTSELTVTHNLNTDNLYFALIYAVNLDNLPSTTGAVAQGMIFTPYNLWYADTNQTEQNVPFNFYWLQTTARARGTSSASCQPIVVDNNTIKFTKTGGSTGYIYRHGMTYRVIIVGE